jgi:NTE family protein
LIPDQVVLGSGGVLGDTWMSALIAGLLDAGGPDLRDAGRLVGTSAGSIVATRLAAGSDLRDYVDRRFGIDRTRSPNAGRGAAPDAAPDGEEGDGGPLGGVASTLLNRSRHAGALFRRTALRAVPEGKEELTRLGTTIDRLMPAWDSRLSLVGVDLRRGSRLVMHAGEDLGLSVSDAVRASCAIPGVFRPVESSRGPIIDGGVWSPVNLDAIRPAPGATVLCLYPSGYRSLPRNLRRSAATGISRARVAVEAAAVRRAGASLLVVSPDPEAALAIGPNRMDHHRDRAVAMAGYRQGKALARRLELWPAGGQA